MSTVSRRTLVRAAAVTVCAGSLLALPAAAALAEGVPAASAAHSAGSVRTLVKRLALADGVSEANVYRLAKGGYQADILAADGTKAATLTSRDGAAGFGGSGPLHAALQPDGRLSSWTGTSGDTGGHAGTPVGDGYKTGTRDGRVVRASAPHARTIAAGTLDALAEGPGDGVLLLAAGGGIAAVGAAGLGFAMLRRGRTGG
ncbi:hypothetical protein AB0I68_03110 [Streptomyces sp. NPDC050448]|uniref:hypothetical protein n=1 Tax=Streptomyces sp. NPDC050448 TaxID=3155404 RepID=UPI003442CFD2